MQVSPHNKSPAEWPKHFTKSKLKTNEFKPFSSVKDCSMSPIRSLVSVFPHINMLELDQVCEEPAHSFIVL